LPVMTRSAGGKQPAALRRTADTLARAAGRLLPHSHQRWAAAMINEVAAIDSDREALRWSAGCLYAACLARGRALHLLDTAAIRWGLVIVAALRALDVSLPTLLTAAYRMQLAIASELGRLTPGDDVMRLVPLMEAIPLWLHAALVAGACCYVLAAVSALRRQPMAAALLLLGVILEQVASLAARPIIAEVGVAAVPNPSRLATIVLPLVLPL